MRKVSPFDSLLEAIRARPGMVLGEPSLSKLQAILTGYEVALGIHKIPHERVGLWRPPSRELPFFHGWVCRRLNAGSSNMGYSQAILKHTGGDEVAALALFWELLAEYRALEARIEGAVLPDSE